MVLVAVVASYANRVTVHRSQQKELTGPADWRSLYSID